MISTYFSPLILYSPPLGVYAMKAIFITFFTTLAAISLSASLFLNTILGFFGMVATPVSTLQNLQTSQNIVKKMKVRQKRKSTKITKRFAKKSAKRIASGAVAAATIGTAAVVGTMTVIEIADYCEEKQEIHEDLNILDGTDTAFDYGQCVDEATEDAKEIFGQLKDSSVAAIADVFNGTIEYGTKQWGAIRKASMLALQSSGQSVSDLWSSIEAWFAEW